MREATYYVQFARPDEPARWHTIGRVSDRALAEEMARLAKTSYMRTTVSLEGHYIARAISRYALRREGGWPHADWELGIGPFREYGEALREKAERNLRAVAS